MKINFVITGVKENTKFLDNLEEQLWTNLRVGFTKYVKANLLPRIKSRLANASKPQQKNSSLSAGDKLGTFNSGGGYGTPKNGSKYAQWKATRSNLPLVGNLSTRELVATGHLVESIDLLRLEHSLDSLSIEVGHKPGTRPATTPFKNNFASADSRGNNLADVSRQIDNIQLAQIIEDSKYAFWVKEFEDVKRDIPNLVTHLISITLKQLWKEYNKK